MPAIAQIISFLMSCKGHRQDEEGQGAGQGQGEGEGSSKKAKWIRFGEEILSATEEAVDDLLKVVNPTLHALLMKSEQDQELKRCDSRVNLNALRSHKGNLSMEVIQTSIQTAVTAAIQSAVRETLKANRLESYKKDQGQDLGTSTSES